MPALTMGSMEMRGEKNTPQAGGSVEIGVNGVIADKPYDNMLNVGDRSMSRERRRLRDRLSDDRNAQDLFKRLFGKCND